MRSPNQLRGKSHLSPVVKYLLNQNKSQDEIATLLGLPTGTIRQIASYSVSQAPSQIGAILGRIDNEFTRVSAVYRCMEVLSSRGWQVGQTDPKCIYDILAGKDNQFIKIQVRSGHTYSARGWPTFKTARIKYNTKSMRRETYPPGSFDYWFFYSGHADCWLIPVDKITAKAIISMEGFDEYKIGE